MHSFRTLLWLGIASLAAACASSPDQPRAAAANPVEGQAIAQVTADSDSLICKRVQKTGTRFNTRVCLTAEQWDSIEANSREAVDEIQRRASQQQDMPGQGN